MQKIFIAILPHGILPMLDQHISRASELGFFENQNCFRCLQDVPNLKMLVVLNTSFEELLQILPMCTSQNFFQSFCTRVLESVLLGMVWIRMSNRYIFVFDFWK